MYLPGPGQISPHVLLHFHQTATSNRNNPFALHFCPSAITICAPFALHFHRTAHGAALSPNCDNPMALYFHPNCNAGIVIKTPTLHFHQSAMAGLPPLVPVRTSTVLVCLRPESVFFKLGIASETLHFDGRATVHHKQDGFAARGHAAAFTSPFLVSHKGSLLLELLYPGPAVSILIRERDEFGAQLTFFHLTN